MDYSKLGDLIFPKINLTPADYELKYPKRDLPEGAKVTRLGPSPTGFIHLGNLYGAFVDERLAHQSDGVFYLRIEDTDEKRYVEGATDIIIDSLDFFGITFDEGATKDGDSGSYGPYYQSQRKEIYQAYIKDLVSLGLAYPCFLNESEIEGIRTSQENAKVTPGIYGSYAKYRDLPVADAATRIESGEEFVIRLKSGGNPDFSKEGGSSDYFTIEDGIRGKVSMPKNFQDVVILKKGGLPTYHLAHVIDDHLMRTTHVVRGEEWLSSLPIHLELFELLALEVPIYCHTAQLMKLDENQNKRKLSKRKDPELSLDFYKEMGYHPMAVREYLLTILNSNFEEWRIDTPSYPCESFGFTLEKMSKSGALFDLNKLNDISKDVLLNIDSAYLAGFLKTWSKTYRPEVLPILETNEEVLHQGLDIGRDDSKPRKDFVCASQMLEFIDYFFDELFKIEDSLPENVSPADAKTIINKYLGSYSHDDTQEEWFGKIREIGDELGYAKKPKDYKKNPDDYKGHVGHVSTVIRLGITGKTQSPDVWQIQQILGAERIVNRLSNYILSL